MQVSFFVFTVYKVLICLGRFIIVALLVIHYRSAPSFREFTGIVRNRELGRNKIRIYCRGQVAFVPIFLVNFVSIYSSWVGLSVLLWLTIEIGLVWLSSIFSFQKN